MTSKPVVHLDVPSQRVQRFIDVPGTLENAEKVLKSRTKTIYFTPTKILVKLLKFDADPVEVNNIILSDDAGNQAFFDGATWEGEQSPKWLKAVVRELLARDYERGGLPMAKSLGQSLAEVEVRREALALATDHHHVNAEWVKCVYDRCGESLHARPGEHPWITARREGWKIHRPDLRPLSVDLVCALDHDSNGNPIDKD